jgi:uncharacterized protein (DUF433 family)
MGDPTSPYIDDRDGGLYLAGSSVSLDSAAIAFQEGASPEKIVESFPTMRLAQVYGAIAYYLENEELINEYLVVGEQELQRRIRPLSLTNPDLFARLQAARRQSPKKPSGDQPAMPQVEGVVMSGAPQ